jgi:Mn-dependent DtxR family transcriptional regulator
MTDFPTYQERLKYILYLVEKKRTGTPKELAEKLGVSESTIKRMVSRLRAEGHNIVYSRLAISYKVDLSKKAFKVKK